mmetsp:Transcript_1888/g.11401  ORF Transcript_1888/g.11401 Transcript_1888/m.11401 type:complete len:117 (-) Transcript_1888:4987-5337(-)
MQFEARQRRFYEVALGKQGVGGRCKAMEHRGIKVARFAWQDGPFRSRPCPSSTGALMIIRKESAGSLWNGSQPLMGAGPASRGTSPVARSDRLGGAPQCGRIPDPRTLGLQKLPFM